MLCEFKEKEQKIDLGLCEQQILSVFPISFFFFASNFLLEFDALAPTMIIMAVVMVMVEENELQSDIFP